MPAQSVLRLLALRKSVSATSSAAAVDRFFALARDEIAGERRECHAALAIRGEHVELLLDAKARHAGELHHVAAVAGFGELGDAADAADLEQVGLLLRTGMRGIRLDHADQPVAVAQRVIDHREIARLENIERHLAARQQQCAGQREHRNVLGQVDRSAIDRIHRHRRPPCPGLPDESLRQTEPRTNACGPQSLPRRSGPMHRRTGRAACARRPRSTCDPA